jgi:FHS family L-fucose permease-like MFS transporter
MILAIGGGCLMPPLQGMMIDQQTIMGLAGVRASFLLPFICFVAIAIYCFAATRFQRVKAA